MRNESDHVLVYLAAVPVAADAPIPTGMTAWDVPAGLQAVFEFPFSDIGRAYPFMFDTWLPGSGRQQDARPVLERYRRHTTSRHTLAAWTSTKIACLRPS